MFKKLTALILIFMVGVFAFAEQTPLLKTSGLNDLFEMEDVAITNSVENWYIDFQSSADTPISKIKSSIKADKDGRMAALIYTGDHTAITGATYVTLKPPFNPILNTESNTGNGRISNVGEIKEIQIKGLSRGYDVTIKLHLAYSSGDKFVITFKPESNEKYGGEFTRVWKNPFYIDDAKKRDYEFKPCYPNYTTDLILEGIELNSKNESGGYFTIRIESIDMIYDFAKDPGETFDDEELWNLQDESINSLKKQEMKKIKERSVIEKQNEILMQSRDDAK